MATMTVVLPTDLIKELKKLEVNTKDMCGKMVKAGAEVTCNNAKAKAPLSSMKSYINVSKVYEKRNGAIADKVQITGYIPFSHFKGNRRYFYQKAGYKTSRGVPADFLAKIYEYGRKGAPFPKKPFFRSSFNKYKIERAMLDEQNRYLKGIFR